MKFRPLAAALAAAVLPSCVTTIDEGYGTAYPSYGPAGVPAYGSTYLPSTYPAPAYGGYGGYGGYGYPSHRPVYRPAYGYPGYGAAYACPICRSSSCRGHHDRDDHHKNANKERDIRLVDNNQNSKKGKDHPTGYHPPEWWKERGYSLEKNT